MMKQLLDENEVLKKQNNFLKLKVELLLDMLAQKSAEADILQKDIDQIRKCLLPQWFTKTTTTYSFLMTLLNYFE